MYYLINGILIKMNNDDFIEDSKSGRPLSYVNAPAKLISLDEAQRIFGGRNKDLPSPLEKVAGREGRPLQIHSIINVPKGFVRIQIFIDSSSNCSRVMIY